MAALGMMDRSGSSLQFSHQMCRKPQACSILPPALKTLLTGTVGNLLRSCRFALKTIAKFATSNTTIKDRSIRITESLSHFFHGRLRPDASSTDFFQFIFHLRDFFRCGVELLFGQPNAFREVWPRVLPRFSPIKTEVVDRCFKHL